jgi:hypothetical protein
MKYEADLPEDCVKLSENMAFLPAACPCGTLSAVHVESGGGGGKSNFIERYTGIFTLTSARHTMKLNALDYIHV